MSGSRLAKRLRRKLCLFGSRTRHASSSEKMSETSVTSHKPEVSGSIPLAGTTLFSICYARNT
jgi:hypothetical protein